MKSVKLAIVMALAISSQAALAQSDMAKGGVGKDRSAAVNHGQEAALKKDGQQGALMKDGQNKGGVLAPKVGKGH